MDPGVVGAHHDFTGLQREDGPAASRTEGAGGDAAGATTGGRGQGHRRAWRGVWWDWGGVGGVCKRHCRDVLSGSEGGRLRKRKIKHAKPVAVVVAVGTCPRRPWRCCARGNRRPGFSSPSPT